jgi:mRNA interferase MazF
VFAAGIARRLSSRQIGGSAGPTRELIVVVPLSSSLPSSRLRPQVKDVEGVDRESRAICRAVRGVARSRLLRPLGVLTPETLDEVEGALALILGLDDHQAKSGIDPK